jgi:hypothetical protein
MIPALPLSTPILIAIKPIPKALADKPSVLEAKAEVKPTLNGWRA